MQRVGEDQIQHLAQEIANDLELGGVQALQGIQATVREWYENTGQSITARTREWINSISQQVNEFGQNIAREIEADAGRDELMGEPSLSDLLPDTQDDPTAGMDINMDDAPPIDGETTLAARASGGGGAAPVSKETPISRYPSLSYGLQETHTTILPATAWFTVCSLGKAKPAQLKIRMNTPYDYMDVTFKTTPASEIVYADDANHTVPGFGVKPVGPRGEVSANSYPAQFTHATSTATEVPGWLHYWAQIYQKYTVLGTEWELIITNPCEHYKTRQYAPSSAAAGPPITYLTPGVQQPTKCTADIVCAVQYDSYSDTAGSSGNIMPVTEYREVRTFKNIQWYKIKDQGGQKFIS